MPYNNAIPQAGDLISASQNDILNNFQAIFNAFDPVVLPGGHNADHINLNSPQSGKHAKITFIPRAAAPVWIAGEAGFYSYPFGGPNYDLFVHNSRYNLDYNVSSRENGSTTLPSGLILKWGTNGNNHVVFTAAFPNQIQSVLLTSSGDPATHYVTIAAYDAGNGGFTVNFLGVVHNYDYLAIGY